MSNRTRAACRFAQVLSRAVEREVEVTYHGSARDSYGGWHVAWCDGPTGPTMQRAVEKWRQAFPEFDGVKLWCDRNRSTQSETAALLAYLEQHPEEAGELSSFLTQVAYDSTEYPERLDERTRERANVLCNLDPRVPSFVTLEAAAELQRRALEGWDAVTAWLDGIIAARKDPTVTDLAAARRERRGGMEL